MKFKGRKVLGVLVAVLALSGLTAASALASSKPFVETKPASGFTKISETEAILSLNGVVNPNGAETKYYFEYGEEKEGKFVYEHKTSEASAGSGTSNVEEAKAIVVKTKTTYHFRIVATNSNGTSFGADETYPNPLAETEPATSIGKTSATLKGVVNPRGFETKYYFEYGTTEAYGTKTAEVTAGSGTSNVEESAAITGLTENTRYHYRIVATNSKGTTRGADELFSAAGLPEITPYTANEKVTGKAEGAYFQSTSKETYECKNVSFTGTMTGLKEIGKVSLTMKCGGIEAFCLQGYEKPWVSKELKGRIAYLSKTSHTVGLLLEPATAGGPIAVCENPVGTSIEIKGSVIAAFQTGGGFKFKEATLQYEGSEGKQKLTHFEGEEALHEIERKSNIGTQAFSMSTALKLTFEKEKELKA
jgi:hypothetical protein